MVERGGDGRGESNKTIPQHSRAWSEASTRWCCVDLCTGNRAIPWRSPNSQLGMQHHLASESLGAVCVEAVGREHSELVYMHHLCKKEMGDKTLVIISIIEDTMY